MEGPCGTRNSTHSCQYPLRFGHHMKFRRVQPKNQITFGLRLNVIRPEKWISMMYFDETPLDLQKQFLNNPACFDAGLVEDKGCGEFNSAG